MREAYEEAARRIKASEAILIGAGAGLSAAAGFEYGGKTFHDNFAYMERKYGAHDMYSAGFAPFEDEEEFWGYWAKMIYLNRYEGGAKPLYQDLLSIVKCKDYFVLTTNVDHQFQKAGFDKGRLFYTQGDYGLFQSTDPKDRRTYDNEKMVREMLAHTDPVTHKIPSSLIPRSPDGHKLTTNLRCDDSFVEDEGWKEAQRRYVSFVESHSKGKLLLLELGVGYNTPVWIKFPFWRYTAENPDAFYICINRGEAACPNEIAARSLCIDGDINEAIESIKSSL